MSPDSFGPITTDMTEAQILDTGAYRVAPSACGLGRLDWHTQKYEASGEMVNEDGETETVYGTVGPGLPSITLDGHGKPQYIDTGQGTRTENGIGRGDTLKEMKAAYGARLVPEQQPVWGPNELHFAVNGKRSHLVFYVDRGKVAGFYLTPGKAEQPWAGADVRGIGC